MDVLAKSDMFFFISTICFVVLTVLVAWFLIYVIAIARDLKKLSRRIEREGQRIADDLERFREEAKGQVLGAGKIFKAIFSKRGKRKGD